MTAICERAIFPTSGKWPSSWGAPSQSCRDACPSGKRHGNVVFDKENAATGFCARQGRYGVSGGWKVSSETRFAVWPPKTWPRIRQLKVEHSDSRVSIRLRSPDVVFEHQKKRPSATGRKFDRYTDAKLHWSAIPIFSGGRCNFAQSDIPLLCAQ